MSTIKDTTRFFVIQGHNKSWVTFGDVKNYIGEVTGGTATLRHNTSRLLIQEL